MEADKVKKVAVLGAGVMGHGIAQVASVAGYKVAVRDIAKEFLDKAEAGVKNSLSRFVNRGRMSQEDMDAALSRIEFTLNLDEAVKGAQLVIEAIPERMDLKHKVWTEAAAKAPKNAILATNTSSLSITKIAESVPNPERFTGMHFFNPPAIMKLVEVIQGEKTSESTVMAVQELARKMGKTPVWVKKDAPGFIVNRILITYLNEAGKLLDKYDMEQIDAAMQHKAGMPLGPFMLSDLIGLDIVYNILKVFEQNIGSDYAPCARITELYETNKLGRKTGEGFYGYETRPSVTEDQAEGFDVKLLLKPFVEEAEKVVAEGIAYEEDVDNAMKLGANLPRGPFEMKLMGLGEEKPVLTEKKDGILTITINRPGKLNSMTTEMLKIISSILDEATEDKSIRCILFKGAGDRAFCAGADISQFPKLDVKGARELSRIGQSTYSKIIKVPKPVVAAVNGYCLGGGNELALHCDFRLASEKASFGQPEVNLGLITGWGATYVLPRLVGKPLASEMMMTGRRLNAKEALSVGLVNAVYPVEEFEEKVQEFVKALVEGPPLAIAAMKKLVNLEDLEIASNSEADEFSNLWNYKDLMEGINAFNERRKPEFKGE
jgi:enoyl-CoA hydratase/3-hydroxyacyl-CoA dehydrogenase